MTMATAKASITGPLLRTGHNQLRQLPPPESMIIPLKKQFGLYLRFFAPAIALEIQV